MGNDWFQFKQFLVRQEQSALRVGTDCVLLGAWSRVTGAGKILDVGTGTGAIALMLAQRSEAEIHAVEINEGACNDALKNFADSPWSSRLKLYHEDFNHFCIAESTLYDLVVCNPPFFSRSLKSADFAATLARHDVALSFEQLISGTRKILAPAGRLSVIVPVDAYDEFRETARLSGFYLSRKSVVIPKTGKPPKRLLLEFSVEPTFPVTEDLVILQGNNKYSDQFVALTKDFYLNFL